MYDSDASTATTALQSSSTAVFTDDTIARILALTTSTGGGDTKVNFATATPDANGNVTVAAGAEVVFIAGSDTQQTTITPPSNAPVLIFQGKGGVVATINDGPSTVPAHAAGVVDRVVIGTAGNDKIVVSDTKNTAITLGSGNSTVVAGGGEDTIHAGLGNSTISGGTGHAIVDLAGKAADYVVTVNNGHAVVTHTGDTKATDITKIQFVQLDNGNAMVFAKDTTEAAVTALYETTFGRNADANGLKFWFDAAKNGASLAQIATEFTKSTEYQATQAASSDTTFLNDLYLRSFGRTGDTDGLAYWTAALQNGATRADLIASFSQVAAHNIDGTVHTETTTVGSVTIVQGIV